MALSRRKKTWLIACGFIAVAAVVGVWVAASVFSRRIEPFLRDQAIAYLSGRFASDVQLAALRIHMPKTSPLRLWRSRGHGLSARVEGEGISMRWGGDRTRPPLFSIRQFAFNVDLGTLWDRKPVVSAVVVDGMEIHVPPRTERPSIPTRGQARPQVRIQDVLIRNALLRILPKDERKSPLEFHIAELRLAAAANEAAMRYQAKLTNPRPPGQIDSTGKFGPWVAEAPGDTPVAGQYSFQNADLGVFAGIAGLLKSQGEFAGTLDALTARGDVVVPDFRLTRANNRVPLRAHFEALVDGTNGNTVLRPVQATLGSTQFTTSGAIIKHEQHQRRTINLEVSMPQGQIRDLLRLATKGSPFMEGVIRLRTRIDIPPLSGKVREKLLLDGAFEVTQGRFLRANVQDQIDKLSRRGQGQPNNPEIDNVISNMKGRFHLENETLRFKSLSFGAPGAGVDLAGVYNLDSDALDFHGSLKLQAKVSQTMTGWKRWALKPADPFFSKHGAGTFLRIKVAGTAKDPDFGLDRGRKDEPREGVRTRAGSPSGK